MKCDICGKDVEETLDLETMGGGWFDIVCEKCFDSYTHYIELKRPT